MAYSNQGIREYTRFRGLTDHDGKLSSDAAGYDIYRAAKGYGVSEDELDAAHGWEKGSSAKWIQSKGLGALTSVVNGQETPVYATNPSAIDSGRIKEMAGEERKTPTFALSSDSLVSSQLQKLLDSNSPYIQRARTRAAEFSNSRGLLNSSMGAGAGEAAAIDAGAPIASGDAQASLQGQLAGYNAQVAFDRDYNAFGREGALKTLGATWDMARDSANRDFQSKERLGAQEFVLGRDNAQREFQTADRLGTQAFTSSRDATQFANRLAEISAQTASQLQVLDRNQGTNLYGSYRTASERISQEFATSFQAIQTADLDPDIKTAQLDTLRTITAQRQGFLNSLYRESPGWVHEWAQIALEVG